MKKLKHIASIIILLTVFISCHNSEKVITESELIELIVNNDVQNIIVINRKYALITVKEEVYKPKFKVNIQSLPEFENKLINLRKDYSFNIEYRYSSIEQFSLFYFLSILSILGFLFYIIAGTICLAITLKNEFKNSIDKIAWVVTIIIAPVIGIILFIVIGRKQIVTSHSNG